MRQSSRGIPYAPPGVPGADHAMNLFRMLAHSQPVATGFAQLGAALLFESSLEPRLREIAILRVGYANAAKYEVGKHVPIGRAVGVSEAALEALQRGALDGLAADEAAVAKFADELVARARAGDEALAAVRAHLDERALVELVVTCGYYGLVCRVLETLGVDSED